MTKQEIVDKLNTIIKEGRYKDSEEREAICEAMDIVEETAKD